MGRAAWTHIPAGGGEGCREGLQLLTTDGHSWQERARLGRAGKVGHRQDGLMKGKPRIRRSLLAVGETRSGWGCWVAPGMFSPAAQGQCQDGKWPLPAQGWFSAGAWLVRVTCRFTLRCDRALFSSSCSPQTFCMC